MNLLFRFVLASHFPQDPGTRAWGEGRGGGSQAGAKLRRDSRPYSASASIWFPGVGLFPRKFLVSQASRLGPDLPQSLTLIVEVA